MNIISFIRGSVLRGSRLRGGSPRENVLTVVAQGGVVNEPGKLVHQVPPQLPSVVRPRFTNRTPKLYVGTDGDTAYQIAEYAKSRRGVPAHILDTEVRHFFLAQG